MYLEITVLQDGRPVRGYPYDSEDVDAIVLAEVAGCWPDAEIEVIVYVDGEEVKVAEYKGGWVLDERWTLPILGISQVPAVRWRVKAPHPDGVGVYLGDFRCYRDAVHEAYDELDRQIVFLGLNEEEAQEYAEWFYWTVKITRV